MYISIYRHPMQISTIHVNNNMLSIVCQNFT